MQPGSTFSNLDKKKQALLSDKTAMQRCEVSRRATPVPRQLRVPVRYLNRQRVFWYGHQYTAIVVEVLSKLVINSPKSFLWDWT